MTIDEVTSCIVDLFFSRRDVYARSFLKPDGTLGYSPSCACSLTCYLGTKCPRWSPSAVSRDVIYTHLSAISLKPFPRTIGAYSTSPNQEVKWVVFDIDTHGSVSNSSSVVQPKDSVAAYHTIKALSETLTDLHLPHYIEESGKGWHIWVFTPLISAGIAHAAGRQIVDMTEECATDVEVFPKQSSIGDGFGNLVKIPYGLHWTGRKCLFVDLKTNGYVQDQWEYLKRMRKVDPLQLQKIAAQRPTLKPLIKLNKVTTSLQQGLLPGPPCVGAMWRAQLREGEGRNQVLHQLAVNLQRSGFLDVEQAKEILVLWNQKQIDPLTDQEFNSAIEHAYSGARYSYGSGRSIIEQYCNVAQCPVCDNPNAKLWGIANASRGVRL